ncbi:MAG: hypothetical protein WCC81_06660 [Pseudolabrys sp.]|jgi:hypothetical protein
MDVWGLILSGIGAVLIAAGQEIVAGVTAIWLRAHEAILGSLLSRGDVHRVSGVDDQMDRAITKNRWLSRAGWSLFVAGIVLQIIPHFRHDGWRALCEPLINLCPPK